MAKKSSRMLVKDFSFNVRTLGAEAKILYQGKDLLFGAMYTLNSCCGVLEMGDFYPNDFDDDDRDSIHKKLEQVPASIWDMFLKKIRVCARQKRKGVVLFTFAKRPDGKSVEGAFGLVAALKKAGASIIKTKNPNTGNTIWVCTIKSLAR